MRTEFKFCTSSLIQCRRGWQPSTSGAARTPSVGCQTFSGQHFTLENNNEHLHSNDCAVLIFVFYLLLICAGLKMEASGAGLHPSPQLYCQYQNTESWRLWVLIRVTEHFLLLCPLKNSGWLQVTPGCHIPHPALPPPIRARLSRSSFQSGQVYHFPEGFPHSYPHH